jgi:hypothetical protein
VRAVVAGENDEGVFRDAEPLEFIEHAADVGIEACDHGGVAFVGTGPIFVGIRPEIRHLRASGRRLALEGVVRMRDDHAPVEEKRLVLVSVHESDRFIGETIIRVNGVRLLGFVAPEEFRIVVVGVGLVEIAEEVVEALFARDARHGFAFVAESPFADERGGVALFFQDSGHGGVLGAEGLGERVFLSGISTDAGVALMLAGHEHAARRGAYRCSGVEMGEPHAFSGHAVDVGGLDDFLAVATGFPIAEIIGEDEDDVRFGKGEDRGEEGEDEDEGSHGLVRLREATTTVMD